MGQSSEWLGCQGHGLPRSLLRALQGVRHEVASQVQPGACQGVRGLDRGGDRGEAGDGGEGPGRLRDCPQGWSSSLPTHQRDLSGVGEEDQHNEGALQAAGEHRDVPQGLAAYGLKEQDLFQVNDLYENKNLYMVVDNLYNLGGMTQKNGWDGPVLGVKQATENKRQFDDEVLKAGQSMIGLQYGTNKGASQAGMTPYGASRQIRPEDFIKNGEP